jgi:hypothetical protein
MGHVMVHCAVWPITFCSWLPFLMFNNQCCGSWMCIPDPDFFPSRILNPGSNNNKKRGKEHWNLFSFVTKLWEYILESESRCQKGTGTRIRIRNTVNNDFRLLFTTLKCFNWSSSERNFHVILHKIMFPLGLFHKKVLFDIILQY